MNEQLDAQLSALLDGELEEFETASLLKKLDQMPLAERDEMLAKWQRYTVAQEALAGERGQAAAPDFAASVAAQLADEVLAAESSPSHAVHDNKEVATAVRTPMWSRLAVAASVAFAVVFGVQQYQSGAVDGASDTSRVAAVEVISTPGNASFGAVASTASAKQAVGATAAAAGSGSTSQARERLHRYLLQHANNAAGQGGQGMAPFARVANFESE